jgi:CheY-like chemotaxis protein
MHFKKSIFLADDDSDDCLLFEDALREVGFPVQLTTANDGLQLMEILDKTVPPPPDVIFLDLNMPCKNGFECLEEIKQSFKLKNIPVVIFSTSARPETIDKVYQQGANYYICKPGSFLMLKKAIQYVLSIDWKEKRLQPSKENFVFQP